MEIVLFGEGGDVGDSTVWRWVVSPGIPPSGDGGYVEILLFGEGGYVGDRTVWRGWCIQHVTRFVAEGPVLIALAIPSP